jgi:hypothetical protein
MDIFKIVNVVRHKIIVTVPVSSFLRLCVLKPEVHNARAYHIFLLCTECNRGNHTYSTAITTVPYKGLHF